MTRSLHSLAGLCLALLLSGSLAQAAIVADFTGDVASNTYPGVTGNGWSGAWGTVGFNSGSTGVTNTSPLAGGGNYLRFTDDTGATSSTLRRTFTNFAEVNVAQPYRITLNYRYDSPLTNFTNFGDRIAIYGDTTGVNSTTSTNTWLIGVVASNTDAGVGQSALPMEWYFFDNNGDTDFKTSNMFDTNLTFVSGRVYSITIDVDPNTGTYGASIDDGVNPVVSATNLTFRRGAGAVSGNVIHFTSNSNNGGDNAAFSIDSIVIVPEPGIASLLLAAGVGAVFARRRRAI